jgi:hypothetical protein
MKRKFQVDGHAWKKPRMPNDLVETLGTRRVETVDDRRDALPGTEEAGRTSTTNIQEKVRVDTCILVYFIGV